MTIIRICNPDNPDEYIDIRPKLLGRVPPRQVLKTLTAEEFATMVDGVLQAKNQRIAELERENRRLEGWADEMSYVQKVLARFNYGQPDGTGAKTVEQVCERIAELERVITAIKPASHTDNAWFATVDHVIKLEKKLEQAREWFDKARHEATGGYPEEMVAPWERDDG